LNAFACQINIFVGSIIINVVTSFLAKTLFQHENSYTIIICIPLYLCTCIHTAMATDGTNNITTPLKINLILTL